MRAFVQFVLETSSECSSARRRGFLSADNVLHEADALYERWPSIPPKDRRKVVEVLIAKIEVGNGELHITYSYLPSSEVQCKSQQKL